MRPLIRSRAACTSTTVNMPKNTSLSSNPVGAYNHAVKKSDIRLVAFGAVAVAVAWG